MFNKFIMFALSGLLVFGFSCSKDGDNSKTIVVGATSVPHAEILENAVKKELEKDGYNLKTVVFSDYILPNKQLEENELDANYYQTLSFMKSQNKEAGLHLKAVVGVHIEPMGVYSQKLKKLSEIKDGAKIGIPNDPDNSKRALNLLVQKGLLKDLSKVENLQDYNSLNKNRAVNPRKFLIIGLEAAQLPAQLPDLDIAVINGNYALSAELPTKNPAIEIEELDENTIKMRANFVVVKQGNEESEKTKALVKAIKSEAVNNYIVNNYKGSVIPQFVEP